MNPQSRHRLLRRPCGFVISGVAAALFCADVHAAVAAEPALVEMSIPRPDDGRMLTAEESREWFVWLAEQGFAVDRCGYDPTSGSFFLDIDSDERLRPLLDAGFQVIRRLDATPLEDAERTQSQYFDPDEIAAMLAQVAADHPAITTLLSVGTTAEGRTIWGIEISNNPGLDEDEPAIQFNAQHHAREVATSQVLMDVVETLTDGYGVDASITSWVDDYKTICVPMVNPDGVQFVFDGTSLWRKNRQLYPPSCTGVDLNRNYPYRWGPD
ncbi:MAG: hypothetical protein IIB57_10940, partial [Planctomycetes bacterium]|nr:hypothetical protein [Planctomycetota bacterium]